MPSLSKEAGILRDAFVKGFRLRRDTTKHLDARLAQRALAADTNLKRYLSTTDEGQKQELQAALIALAAEKTNLLKTIATMGAFMHTWNSAHTIARVSDPTQERVEQRTAIDIVKRASCCIVISARAMGATLDYARSFTKRDAISQSFTPVEIAFLREEKPSEALLQEMMARIETAHVFYWALGFWPDLNEPIGQLNADPIFEFYEKHNSSHLISKARERPQFEIAEKLEYFRRIHLICETAMSEGERPPASIHPLAAFNKRLALEWLARDDDWDILCLDIRK